MSALDTATLTLTAAELADLRSAVRAQVRLLAAEADDGRTFGFRATRLALLSPEADGRAGRPGGGRVVIYQREPTGWPGIAAALTAVAAVAFLA